MAKRTDQYQDERGPSARHLVLMFLAAVAVCAVFFSLGYVVGYNHSPSRGNLTTEDVNSSGNIPPTVNPAAGGSSSTSNRGMETENINPGSTSITEPERPKPLPQEPAETAQSKSRKPVEKSAAQTKPKHRPARSERKVAHSTAKVTSRSHFAVQVMASKTRADAEHLVKLLKSHGYRVFTLTPQEAHAKDKLFRVQVGPFTSRVQADRARDKLESEGFRPFVVH